MSDEIAQQFASPTPPEPPANKARVIVIRMEADGTINFSWPTNGTKVEVYGLLEVARAQFDKMVLVSESHQAQANAAAARGGLAGLRRRMTGGH